MNWMFDNNIMHLSQEAAQKVNDLRVKVAEQEAAISSLRTLVSSQARSDNSGEFWFETLQRDIMRMQVVRESCNQNMEPRIILNLK